MTLVAPDPTRRPDPERRPGSPRGRASAATNPATKTNPSAAAAGGHLPYFPAIEGLRGAAVIAVLLFHAGFGWMQGGFLGVSTFFTLSGFLITSLLLAERDATGTVALRQFWLRRFRRLMPAALAALALVAVFGVVAADAVVRRNLAGDVLSALAYVANWRFLFSNQSYADLFAAPSPVLHFWSLAIEEQFYLLYPLVAWLVLRRRSRRRSTLVSNKASAQTSAQASGQASVEGSVVGTDTGRWKLGAVLLGLTAASLALTLVGAPSADTVYYSTGTRAAELLIGGLLAVAIAGRPGFGSLARNDRIPRSGRITVDRAVNIAGVIALAISIAVWVLVPRNAEWLYRGGFAAYALVSAALILSCISPAGPARRLLASAPLRQLGRISYGVYLYHWPVFLWLTPERTGLSEPMLLGLRVLVTLALALASFHWLETPVRQGRTLLHRPPIRVAPVVIGVLALSIVAITITAPQPVVDFDHAAVQMERLTTSAAPPAAPFDPKAAEPPFPRIATFGDSAALTTALGVSYWAAETRLVDTVEGAAWLGCGIGRGGQRRANGEVFNVPAECSRWQRTWSQKIRDNEPNIALVQTGRWDVEDRKLDGETVWRAPGNPAYDAYLMNEMLTAVDTLSAGGAVVIWLTSPPVGEGKGKGAVRTVGPGADPARTNRLNQLINELPDRRPGRVRVLDLAGWLASTGEDNRLRPDGVHFGSAEGYEVARRWLGQAVIDTFRQAWTKRVELESPQKDPRATAAPMPGLSPDTPYLGPRRKVLVIGDAAADAVADGLAAWGSKPATLEVARAVKAGCGVLPTIERDVNGVRQPTPAACEQAIAEWVRAAASTKPDVVLVVASAWDLTDVKLKGDTAFRSFGDPVLEAAYRKAYADLSAKLTATGTLVAWLNTPPDTTSDPARAARHAQVLQQLMQETDPPRAVRRIDLARFAARQLPSGVSADAAPLVSAWLGTELLVFRDEYRYEYPA